MEREVLGGTGRRFAIPGAGVHRWEGCGDAGNGYFGAGSGAVQRSVPEVTDEASETGGAQAERGGRAAEQIAGVAARRRLLLQVCERAVVSTQRGERPVTNRGIPSSHGLSVSCRLFEPSAFMMKIAPYGWKVLS